MNTKPRLWLHLGPAKTGTKSIKKSLRQRRSKRKWHGVSYPKSLPSPVHGRTKFNHHNIAKALIAGDIDFVMQNIENLPEAPDTVISSEGFSKCDLSDFQKLSSLLTEHFSVAAIYHARSPVDRANSQAQQYIKTGKKSYAEPAHQLPPNFHTQ